jgi:glutaminyl-peptide cyclotransferase
MRALEIALAACVAVWLGACQASPPPSRRQAPVPDSRAEAFDARRAWSHVEALAAIGPRPMGSEGAERARAYLRGQLEALGLEIREQQVQVTVGDAEPFDLVNLAGRIPGRSDDAIVIAASYDTRAVENFEYLGVNEAASGPAVVLEMARVLSRAPLDYTTWVVFLDGEAPLGSDEPPAHYGARALSKRLADEHVLEQIRLALVIGSVCDPELRIARDLLSERIYRQEFWRSAARLGHRDAFPTSPAFESPDASQRAFSDAGLRRVVALVDTSFGGDEPPGVYAGTRDDDLEHCSAQSLAIVGAVSLDALGTISARLAKIDRFAHSPVSEAQELAWDTLVETESAGSDEEAEPAGSAQSAAPENAEAVESSEAADAPAAGEGGGATAEPVSDEASDSGARASAPAEKGE